MSLSETVYSFITDPISKDRLAENKIRSFSHLPLGWHYGEGALISDEVINMSLELSGRARELMFFEIDAFPGANGEVLLSIYQGNYTLEFIVEPDLSITATLESGKEEIYDIEELSVAEAKDRIRSLRKDIWTQSDFSTQSTTVTSVEDSQASHSKTLEKIRAFPSLTLNAYSTPATQYVATSENIIREQHGNHLYIGGSIQKYYPVTSS